MKDSPEIGGLKKEDRNVENYMTINNY